MNFPYSLLALGLWLSLVPAPLNAQDVGDSVDSTSAVLRSAELVQVFMENAASFRNYDLVVHKSVLFEPVDQVTKAEPFIQVMNYRILMDWKDEKCFFVRHSYRESPESKLLNSEAFVAFEFSKGVRSERQIANALYPNVENMSFHRFLAESRIPMAELAGLHGFPGYFDGPFDEAAARAKELKPGAGMSFRTLPDGTGVRTAKNRLGESTTHFSASTLMPISIAVNSSQNAPPTSHQTTYDLVDGVYRPKEIISRENTFFAEGSLKPDGSNIKYMNGRGTAKYTWNKFNEGSLEFPDSSVLTPNKDSWIKFIGVQD